MAATDNSIYEVLPAAICYPRVGADVNAAIKAARRAGLLATARGGNTGTNGQSLNSGLILDFSRHMTCILALDVQAGSVTVEPGVVLDQLNVTLAQHGLFFPPTVSSASRATLGGMVATDAAGKGSRVYGKTSAYVQFMDVVLANAEDWHVEPLSLSRARSLSALDDHVRRIHKQIINTVVEHRNEIRSVFPKLDRGLTGYNLQDGYDAEADRFFLAPFLAGSEGTLAITKAVMLRLARKPPLKALVVTRYSNFDDTVNQVHELIRAEPLAVNILDEKILGLAQDDIL